MLLAGHDSQSEERTKDCQLRLFRSKATKKRTIAPPKAVAQAATRQGQQADRWKRYAYFVSRAMFLLSSLRPRQGPSFLLTKKGGKDVPKGVPPLGIPQHPGASAHCVRLRQWVPGNCSEPLTIDKEQGFRFVSRLSSLTTFDSDKATRGCAGGLEP